MRVTDGKYLSAAMPVGKTASSREYGRSHSPTSARAVCGAPRSTDVSGVHSPHATRSISPLIAITASMKRSSSGDELVLFNWQERELFRRQ
jgi:hypothetical protein